MGNIYVTGHRNPDTDSIVASIAYANLRNALGDREYKAVRIGNINDETRHILELFDVKEPEYIKNMRTQLIDINLDHPPAMMASVSMARAWTAMSDNNISTMPILNEDGTLYGLLSAGDIATYDMNAIFNSHIDDLPLFNLVSVLEGRVVNEFSNTTTTISGDVIIGLPSAFETNPGKNGIVICGNQPDMVEKSIADGASCIILCQAEINPLWEELDMPCIISTPMDARTVSRIIYQAMPVSGVCNRDGIICFHLSDYLDDVREVVLSSRYRAYPVLDSDEHVVGIFSRYHLLRPNRKKVVLVDHNEAAQSVIGLDQVDILEIIDHHRLADIQTSQPVSVRNEPVGSTNTIITSMYQEHGVVPSPKIAGLMAAAILSDTVMFKSPTCTGRDIAMAERLARIANISLDKLGKDIFSAGFQADKDVSELLHTDYKEFHISGQNLGVGQITCVDAEPFLSRKQEFLDVMLKTKTAQDLDFVILMLTDILSEGSHLIYIGNDDVIAQAFIASPKDNYVFLPKVMSRKKQVIPMLTALWG